MMKNKILLLLSLLLVFSSCEQLTGSSTGANLLDKSLSTIVGGLNAISAGSGKFLLEGTASNGGNSGHSFRLRFKLPEGETLSFFFFAPRGLTEGVKYTFSRNSGVVRLDISLNGKNHGKDLTEFNDSNVVDVDLDIHNDHTDSHFLLWERDGQHGDSEDCSFDGSCLYNSEDFAFDAWLGVGKGSGTFWGFSGDATLIELLEGPNPALSDV